MRSLGQVEKDKSYAIALSEATECVWIMPLQPRNVAIRLKGKRFANLDLCIDWLKRNFHITELRYLESMFFAVGIHTVGF